MRLLLAEDERTLSDALVAILTHSNYSVDAVYDGQEALDYLENGEYDGAILDIMMPKIDGVTVLKTIRAAGNTVPVLFLTAKSEIDDRVDGLDAGADDYLTKPFASKELLARIRAMTRRQPALQDTDLHFGNIVLSRTDSMLSGPSGSARLANKEYQILEMLMINPGQTVSTERFLEKIWGYDSDAEINVVWVNLSALRKKLASVGADVQIRANRGLGYSLEVST
ncbi:MAG: response regulator transcription factor [Oscillospiraceae bacterium]